MNARMKPYTLPRWLNRRNMMEYVFKQDINTVKQTLHVPQTPDFSRAGNYSANSRSEL